MTIVFERRAPFKIADVVVHLVAVAVIDLRLVFGVGNECFGNEAMNFALCVLAVLEQ